MRFLKNKIALSAQLKANHDEIFVKKEEKDQTHTKTMESKKITKEPSNRGRKKAPLTSKEDKKSTKTIVKNYGKAISSFAISSIAVPYLVPLLNQEQVKLNEFVDYIGKAKETIEGIDTFRALLLAKPNDEKKAASFKTIFRTIAEIFIKYFSVNWIFSGRMSNKKVHLQYRFKMLRRVQSPELFTYLK